MNAFCSGGHHLLCPSHLPSENLFPACVALVGQYISDLPGRWKRRTTSLQVFQLKVEVVTFFCSLCPGV
jgi:hypothetical protein